MATAFVLAGTLITLYIILVTFFPAVQGMAKAFASPGGLLLIGWMALLMVRLF